MGTRGTAGTPPKVGTTAAGAEANTAADAKAEEKLLSTAKVLRAEAKAIHDVDIGKDANEKDPGRLYRELHGLNSTALCLSGGGIRSASFALGVIEALAVHPRQTGTEAEGKKVAASAQRSLLSQFHYLSTVSGGGYIGSWLSAWITRAGYANVWSKLVGRRDEHPEKEPSEIAWLRAYSNFLTPRLGLFSADTWTAVALVVRNLILNWLVILSALCLVLLGVKMFAVAAFWVRKAGFDGVVAQTFMGRSLTVAFAVVAALLMIWALGFALLNRPSRNPDQIAKIGTAPQPSAAGRYGAEMMKDPLRNEAARPRWGADKSKFVLYCLLPAVMTALLLSIYLSIRGSVLASQPLWFTAGVAALVGMAVYALAWIVTFPPFTWRRVAEVSFTWNSIATRRAIIWKRSQGDSSKDPRPISYWVRDFASWSIAAGGVYGAIVGLSVYLVAKFDLFFLIGNAFVPKQPTGYFLIALIYGVPWIITAQLTAEMIFVGLTNWQRFSDADREWFGRSTGWFAVAAFMWFAVAFLVLIAGEVAWGLVAKYDSAKVGGSLLAALSALFTTLGGKSSKSSATDEPKTKTDMVMRIALPLAAILFLLLLVLVVSVLLDYLLLGKGLLETSLLGTTAAGLTNDLKWLWIGIGLAAVIAGFTWTHVNINRFSIHALYRNRLIRGYLGASNANRAPNPFTGFDEDDNTPMAGLWPPAPGQWRPFHVVNIALNVVNSKRLAWQERKAEPFTATPLHCGTAADGLGYRLTKEYGDMERGGISLGTALAISGAAASPNMGYNSSSLVTLMLALFNVRLGWWLGNPGPKGEKTYPTDGPNVAIKPFVAEMFGLTTDDRRYVYLSDGGHFENLGLYEMVRRRCRCIVISDAGCDPEYGFEDLGNAVRKIAIDLGIYITFGELRKIRRRSKDNSVIEGAYYAIGEIDYKTAPENLSSSEAGKPVATKGPAEIENGYILYIKPSYHGTETPGIVAYATANAAFPHETTGDQFFSESQFESYRTLGFEIMDGALNEASRRARKSKMAVDKLVDLVKALRPPTKDEPEIDGEQKRPRVSGAQAAGRRRP